MSADSGLAAGDPHGVEREQAHAHAGDALDLVERQHVGAWQPLHSLGRHAVGTPEVAPVGDGDPQVAHGPAERVDQVGRGGRGCGGGGRDSYPSSMTSTGSPAATPSPSGTSASAFAAAIADST